MAQDTDLTPPGAVAPSPSVPVFGRRADAFEDRRYRTFALEVEGKRSARDRTEQRWIEEFDCFMDVDGGMWVSLGNAHTQIQVAQATVRFLGANLRDDDGVSMDWVPPATPELADPDDPDSDWLREDAADPASEPLYLGWDGELYVKRDYPVLEELADGSSRRRFAFISDDMNIRYTMEALQEVADWLTNGATARPTKRPVPSGHGPQRTGRGSGGKRR